MSKAWTHAHPERPRGLAMLWLWHGTLPAAASALRTSGIALSFVLERLSSIWTRLQEPSPRLPGLCRQQVKPTSVIPSAAGKRRATHTLDMCDEGMRQ